MLFDDFSKMNIAFLLCWNVLSILAKENPLLIVGGVQKLLFEDYYSSIVTEKVEVVGCTEITFPNYPSPIFGPSLFLVITDNR